MRLKEGVPVSGFLLSFFTLTSSVQSAQSTLFGRDVIVSKIQTNASCPGLFTKILSLHKNGEKSYLIASFPADITSGLTLMSAFFPYHGRKTDSHKYCQQAHHSHEPDYYAVEEVKDIPVGYSANMNRVFGWN